MHDLSNIVITFSGCSFVSFFDANSFFSKPSIRTIDGLEILAKIIQPDKFEDIHVSEESFSNI